MIFLILMIAVSLTDINSYEIREKYSLNDDDDDAFVSKLDEMR